MNKTERIAYLTKAALQNIATEQELSELLILLQDTDPEKLHPQMEGLLAAEKPVHQPVGINENWDELVNMVLSADKQAPVLKIHFLQPFKWLAAAIFLLMAAGSVYYLINQPIEKPTAPSLASNKDVSPGREGAKLKLSNGRVIIVDTAKEGLIATEGTLQIFKENGKIVYKGSADQMVYNEITTDKGRVSTAVLPDGSFVWLNAASSIRYPLQFTGSARKIWMTGQASFKVIHNAAQPFRVEVSGQLIEDIGTEFDVNAYSDESSVKTTLIEGSASVSTASRKEILKQGQQSVITHGADLIKVSSGIDVENVIAWRNGKFKFENADIYTTMRQVARWYDVEIVYEGNMTTDTFTGGTFRNENLSEVLKVLELNGGVHFKIEGKKLIVRP